MNIADTLDGATRLVAIIGDPIAQVKSPAGVTQSLIDRDRNAIVVPIHVTTADLERFIQGVSLARNLDGIIVTVPHKFDVFRLCATTTERAQFLGAVNVLRRKDDGSWHGDHADGVGFVEGIRTAGCRLGGRQLLIEEGRVVGAVVQQPGGDTEIRANRGVVLACGGFPHDPVRTRNLRAYADGPRASVGGAGLEHRRRIAPRRSGGRRRRDRIARGGRVGTRVARAEARWQPSAIFPIWSSARSRA